MHLRAHVRETVAHIQLLRVTAFAKSFKRLHGANGDIAINRHDLD